LLILGLLFSTVHTSSFLLILTKHPLGCILGDLKNLIWSPWWVIRYFNALAAWHSGHRVLLQNRRSRFRVPPVLLSKYVLSLCVMEKKNVSKN
jgi:chorismate-pyruvate lyase